MIEISFSTNGSDQRRLAQAGGYIHLKADGRPVFRFDTKESYQRYLALNRKTA